MNPFPYYRGLDAVRGIAVLMVILYHSRLLPAGWIGIQIFFVLSGFLITGILRAQVDRPFPTFIGGFYWRRCLRIWPMYYLLLALCALGYAIWRVPVAWNVSWPWLVTFTYNLPAVFPDFPRSDYFGHFWTLSVEEQFYIVWPLAVFGLSLRRLRQFALTLIVLGPVLRYLTGRWMAGVTDDPITLQWAVHNLPTSHLDAFASGALLTILPDHWRARWSPRAVPVLFVVMAVTLSAGLAHAWWVKRHGWDPHWMAFGYDHLEHFSQYVWAYTLLNLWSVCLIFCALQERVVARLPLGALVRVGTISYGLYLWHFPLRQIFLDLLPGDEHSRIGLLRFVLYFVTCLGVSALSYYQFERYWLRLKKLRPGVVLKAVVPPAA